MRILAASTVVMVIGVGIALVSIDFGPAPEPVEVHVRVDIEMPGATAEAVDRRLLELHGFDRTRSVARAGHGRIDIRFVGLSEEEALHRARAVHRDAAVRVVGGRMVTVCITGSDGAVRSHFARDVRKKLIRTPGVFAVTLAGDQIGGIEVVLEASRLEQFGIHGTDVRRAIEKFEPTTGAVGNLAVRTVGRAGEAAALEAVVVAQRDGQPIYVRDIALVRWRSRWPDGHADSRGPAVLLRVNCRRDTKLENLEVPPELHAEVLENGETVRVGWSGPPNAEIALGELNAVRWQRETRGEALIRGATPRQILAAFRELPGVIVRTLEGPSVPGAVSVHLVAADAAVLGNAAKQVQSLLHGVDGAMLVACDLEPPRREVELEIDKAKVAALGTNEESIRQAVALRLDGVKAGPAWVRIGETPADLKNLAGARMLTENGVVPLEAMARLRMLQRPTSIRRLDGELAATVTVVGADEASVRAALSAWSAPGVSIRYR